MAPGRKRGANKTKPKSQLSLGDLVLAKVKGYPFWPAKISRPEDVQRPRDPKKYFVTFFGTQEIAFVGASDIQVFTSEVKSKLSARCQGKKDKFFSQAVKEICAAFEELQNGKPSGLEDSKDISAIGCESPSINGMEEDGVETGATGETWDAGIDSKSSPVLSFEKKVKISNGEQQQEVLSTSSLDDASFVKDEKSGDVSEECMKEPDTVDRAWRNGDEPMRKMEDTGKDKDKDRTIVVKTVKGGKSGACIPSESDEVMRNRVKNEIVSDGSTGGKVHNKMKRAQFGPEEEFQTTGTLRPAKKSKHVNTEDDAIRRSHTINLKSNSLSSDVVEYKKTVKLSVPHRRRDIVLALKAERAKEKSNVFSVTGKAKAHASSHVGKVKSTVSIRVGDVECDAKGKAKSESSNQPTKVKSEVFDQSGKIKSDASVSVAAQTSKAESDILVQTVKVKPDISADEAVLPVLKRRRRALEAMCGSAALNIEDKIENNNLELKNDLTINTAKLPVSQLPKRRRAVCLYDDDDEDEKPKTPVHGGLGTTVRENSSFFDAPKRTDAQGIGSVNQHGNSILSQAHGGNSAGPEHSNLKESSSQLHSGELSSSRWKNMNRHGIHVRPSPQKSEPEQLLTKETKSTLTSPKISPHRLLGSKQVMEHSDVAKPSVKTSTLSTQKGALAGPVKVSAPVLDGSRSSASQIHLPSQRNRPAFSVERPKSTPKSISRMSDAGALAETAKSISRMSDTGASAETLTEPEAFMGGISSGLVDSKTPDSGLSMKDLIAAAQAKRKQAHSQHFYLGNPSTALAFFNDTQGTSSSPSPVQLSLSGTITTTQPDLLGSQHHQNLVSPPSLGQQNASGNQVDTEEIEEQRVGSGHRPSGGSLSGGTEASVSRDAFEGMIETLSRTKDSIGRATRLAIDCAKYGIANEVVELLIRKLESEPSYHRKVDLFFLVDSITQCSHSQKGIAGASYVPTVQAALPRLLAAAAPSGGSARENRRQCLKVLRLWLERKIFPDSLLRRYMDEIGVSNDDFPPGISFRRPTRAERAVDDPIREMEGMLVDEYGSNATFQLPGLLSSRMFEDEEEEEDFPHSSPKESTEFPSVPDPTSSAEPETVTVTPNDRRHHILEDVDGELEMEDVSGQQKDERALSSTGSFEMDAQQHCSHEILETAVNNSVELPPLPDGSPPPLPPPSSPPPLPPLPSSPPPPPPLPPPPPPTSPSPPPPPPPPLPSLPLPLPLRPPPPPAMPLGPQLIVPQPSMPTQPSVRAQQSSVQSSPQLAYQPAFHGEYCSASSGNQLAQMAGNTSQGNHADSLAKGELFVPQSPCFVPMPACSSRESSGFNSSRNLEYGHHELHSIPQGSQQNPHFPPVNAPFMQRPIHLSHMQTPGHFPYAKATTEQHPQHSYPRPYPLPTHPDAQRTFGPDDRWRMPSSEFHTDQHGGWMGGRTLPLAGPPIGQEGYFRPLPERPPVNNMGFQVPASSNLPAGAPTLSGVSQMLPVRPDMSALSCWRPA